MDPNSQAFRRPSQHDTEQGVRAAARKAAEEATGSTFWGDAAAGRGGARAWDGQGGEQAVPGPRVRGALPGHARRAGGHRRGGAGAEAPGRPRRWARRWGP